MSQLPPAGLTDRRRSARRITPAEPRLQLRLLNAFELSCDGAPVALPRSAQRLVALLAVGSRPLQRAYVAGTLWPEASEERAHASLRSALWRIHRLGKAIVEANGACLQLAAAVEVDVHDSEILARRVLGETDADGVDVDPSPLLGDLLPDWYEDWVLLEQERFRQLRLCALDALCERLMCAGRFREALGVGFAALGAEPLRESAHRALVRIHLAAGNAGEAVRQYRLCRRLLAEHLGIQPSEQMEQLVRGVAAPGA